MLDAAERAALGPILPGRQLRFRAGTRARSAIWLEDRGTRVALLAFDEGSLERAEGEARDGRWRLTAEEGRKAGAVSAEDADTGAVALRATPTPQTGLLAGARPHFVVEHAGHVFQFRKELFTSRYPLTGDGRQILVVRGTIRRGRVDVVVAPAPAASLPLLALYAVFFFQRWTAIVSASFA